MKKDIFFAIIFSLFAIALDAQTVINLEKDGGVYKIPCIINGLKLKLIFDTGASNVCVSESVAQMMLENDYLSIDDIKGTSQSQVADGRIVNNTRIVIKKIQIGDKILNNIEAVVVHGQSAPLLLGQSAISKLGKYSISGDKLVIGSERKTTNGNNWNYLSESDQEKLFGEAIKYYKDGLYSVALESFKMLYSNELLSAYGKMLYANCFYYTDRKENALDIYLSIEDDIEYESPEYLADLYYQIGRSFWVTEDYDSAIPYLERAKVHCKPWSFVQENIVSIISSIYYDKGDVYKAGWIVDQYISQYLSFMEIKATDCWDKCYTDKFLSDLYFNRYLRCNSDNRSEGDKYIIISAAWGNDKAIEYCKEFSISYTSKPYKYEY
ncbi:retroviral-like aspartic protease family protein [Parabacteroides distasonis]|nr:retroviral-like aspartic protease family protein [Parabacteroides distasonis]